MRDTEISGMTEFRSDLTAANEFKKWIYSGRLYVTWIAVVVWNLADFV